MVLRCDDSVVREQTDVGITTDPQWQLRAMVHARHAGLWICHKWGRCDGSGRLFLNLSLNWRRNGWCCGRSHLLVGFHFLKPCFKLLNPLEQLLDQHMVQQWCSPPGVRPLGQPRRLPLRD